MMTSMNGLTRGQLAKACNMGPETIRFYEREGLLPLPDRTAAGYRSFSTETVHRLNFIQRAKNLGFSLREINDLLALHDNEDADRSQVKNLAGAKLAEIEQKISDLTRMQATLKKLFRQCSGKGSISGCPIIQSLSD